MTKGRVIKYVLITVGVMAFLIQSCHSDEAPKLASKVTQRKNQPLGTDLENALQSLTGKDKHATTHKACADTASAYALIETTLGDITVILYGDTPKHKRNFVKLADEGYYNGVLFHRVIKNFMIQTGDPNTKDPEKEALYGQGGPGYTIPAEFLPNHKHNKGALAAARKGDAANPYKESSGSQFYIVQDENGCKHLNGSYTVFGQVIEGLDIVDKIAAIPTDYTDRPIDDVRIIKITILRPEAEEDEEAVEEVCDSLVIEGAGYQGEEQD